MSPVPPAIANTCCISGCRDQGGCDTGISFVLPSLKKFRVKNREVVSKPCSAWIASINWKSWVPSQHSTFCSEHLYLVSFQLVYQVSALESEHEYRTRIMWCLEHGCIDAYAEVLQTYLYIHLPIARENPVGNHEPHSKALATYYHVK